jgi:hypothetical protein
MKQYKIQNRSQKNSQFCVPLKNSDGLTSPFLDLTRTLTASKNILAASGALSGLLHHSHGIYNHSHGLCEHFRDSADSGVGTLSRPPQTLQQPLIKQCKCNGLYKHTYGTKRPYYSLCNTVMVSTIPFLFLQARSQPLKRHSRSL